MTDSQTQPPQPPPFDPSKPHHTKPKLRPVRPIQLQHNNQPVLGLRDATQISERMVVTSPLAQFILGHMDGNHEIGGIINAAKAQAQQVGVPPQAIEQITEQPIQQLIAQLDDAGMLEGPTFEALRDKVREQFDSSDVLPPAASADFADALVMQELGEEATDEQKKAMGPQKLADQLDSFMDEAMKKAEDPAFDTLPRAVIAPHLDYGRGWLNYAHTYARLRVADRPDRVIILGTNHFGQGTGVVGCDKGYETPLGTCQADSEFLDTLKSKLGSENAEKLMAHRFDHEREHSIELHIPWIQHVFRNPDSGDYPKVLGILVHDPVRNNGESYDGNGLGIDPFVEALKATIAEMPGKTLLVSSADLSHIGKAFGDQHSFLGDDEQAKETRDRVLKHDQEMIDLIKQAKADELITSMSWQQNPTRWCSIGNLVVTMRATDADEVKVLHYAAAGDQQGMALVSSMAGAIF
jgi:hypothetical protein